MPTYYESDGSYYEPSENEIQNWNEMNDYWHEGEDAQDELDEEWDERDEVDSEFPFVSPFAQNDDPLDRAEREYLEDQHLESVWEDRFDYGA
jgi:hypothetical protein